MKQLYLYNKNTHMLHIRNGCIHADGRELMPFTSENKALAYAGRTLGMCKLCMEKRDAILYDYLKERGKL